MLRARLTQDGQKRDVALLLPASAKIGLKRESVGEKRILGGILQQSTSDLKVFFTVVASKSAFVSRIIIRIAKKTC